MGDASLHGYTQPNGRSNSNGCVTSGEGTSDPSLLWAEPGTSCSTPSGSASGSVSGSTFSGSLRPADPGSGTDDRAGGRHGRGQDKGGGASGAVVCGRRHPVPDQVPPEGRRSRCGRHAHLLVNAGADVAQLRRGGLRTCQGGRQQIAQPPHAQRHRQNNHQVTTLLQAAHRGILNVTGHC